MDGVREFGSKVTAELLALMQTKQSTPVPYRPNLLGLVERFHRMWKDMISLYVDDALYAYNPSRHTAHGYQPNELMMGRKLRTPQSCYGEADWSSTLDEYHEVLMQELKRHKKQARQAMYYNQRNVRGGSKFRDGQLVWVYRPAKAPGITKFGHRWRGPGKIVEAAGYGNYLVQMLELGQELVIHCSFLLSYYSIIQLT
eukprot:jgi/Phyca11/129900/e_gw1.89.101.1